MAFVRFKRSDIDARWAMAGKSMELQLVVDWDLATWVWPVMILTGMIVLEIRKPREDLLRGLLRGLAFAVLFSVHPYTALFYLAFTVLLIVFGV